MRLGSVLIVAACSAWAGIGPWSKDQLREFTVSTELLLKAHREGLHSLVFREGPAFLTGSEPVVLVDSAGGAMWRQLDTCVAISGLIVSTEPFVASLPSVSIEGLPRILAQLDSILNAASPKTAKATGIIRGHSDDLVEARFAKAEAAGIESISAQLPRYYQSFAAVKSARERMDRERGLGVNGQEGAVVGGAMANADMVNRVLENGSLEDLENLRSATSSVVLKNAIELKVESKMYAFWKKNKDVGLSQAFIERFTGDDRFVKHVKEVRAWLRAYYSSTP